MPRKMSCMLTIPQVNARTKLVTRRLGWWFLQPGDIVDLVEKAMGLQKGEKQVYLATVEIVEAAPQQLRAITEKECALEGFPDMIPGEFIEMFCKANRAKGCTPLTLVNRIRWKYT